MHVHVLITQFNSSFLHTLSSYPCMQIVNVIAIQVKHMNGSFIVPNTDKTCSFSDSSVWVFNIATILIAIPILNQCVFPFLREYTPNMRKRIGVGYVMTILSPFILLIISIVGYAQLSSRGESGNATMSCMFVQNSTNSSSNVKLPINSLFTLLPHLTVSLAEMFAIVAGKLAQCMAACHIHYSII